MENLFENCYYAIYYVITYGHSDKGSTSVPIPKIGPYSISPELTTAKIKFNLNNIIFWFDKYKNLNQYSYTYGFIPSTSLEEDFEKQCK